MYFTKTERALLESTLYNLLQDVYHNIVSEPSDARAVLSKMADKDLEAAINHYLSGTPNAAGLFHSVRLI